MEASSLSVQSAAPSAAMARNEMINLTLSQLGEWILPCRDMERRSWPLLIGIGYIGLIAVLGGLRPDHVWLALLAFLDLYNQKTRLFLRYFFPFILTGAVYDFMRYFYWQGIAGRVHVGDPYFRDLAWFGVQVKTLGGLSRVTPNEFFQIHHWPILDFFSGFAYLTYVGEYLLAAFYLYFRGQWALLRLFGWCFFTVNVLGFVTYFIYPAAPPWYVAQYGFGPARMDVLPNAAAAHRFDLLLGTHFFDQMYARGVDVYGAYPSLHVAYPLLTVWICFQLRELRWFRAPAVAFYALMCLSAVYLQHHYVVDIVLGTSYALGVICAARVLQEIYCSKARVALETEENRNPMGEPAPYPSPTT